MLIYRKQLQKFYDPYQNLNGTFVKISKVFIGNLDIYMDSWDFPVKTILKTKLKAGNVILSEYEIYYRLSLCETGKKTDIYSNKEKEV